MIYDGWGREIESIEHDVDVATTIIGLARYSDDYTRSAGPSMMFAKDITNTAGLTQFIVQRPKNNAGAADVDVENMIINTDPNCNLRAATLISMLEGQRKSFSCAIPLHH